MKVKPFLLSLWRVRGRGAICLFWKEVVWCLVDIDVGSVKTGVCYLKKKHNFLSSNQLKNKTPLVNQLKLQGA